MKIELEIKDSKAAFFLELVKSFNFVKKVKIEKLEKEPTKKEILDGIREAVKEVNLIKAGKMKGISARELNEFLNELK